MIQLKPHMDNSFVCPECRANNPTIKEIRFESVNILAECACSSCTFEFYQVLPVGHMVDHPFSIAKQSKKLYRPEGDFNWLSESLLKSHVESRANEVNIEKIIFKKYDKVVILNTLDSLYGHVLLKLYNAFHHLDQPGETGLIIIIPKLCKWLIPPGCAEAWVVDLKLSELIFGYDSIRKFVSREITRFQEVYLSKAYSHPNLSTQATERLTGVTPFNLMNFSKLPRTVTFVLREDRWWLTQVGDYWFYRICRKLNIPSWGNYVLSLRQNKLIKRVIRLIRKEQPDVNFNIVGLGKTGNFEGYANDERQVKVDDSIETAWCKTYARSHIVIGVHGSNMLLPTALAAGCVEVLPQDRYGNMVQDLTVRYSNRLQLFFYRFVDQFANPKSVSSKVLAIFRDYEGYTKNMCNNVYSSPANDLLPQMTMMPVIEDE